MTDLLAGARVDEAVWEKFPEYVAAVALVTNLVPGPSSVHSEQLLRQAEMTAREWLATQDTPDLPEVAQWRQAYAAFGVKPRQARSSVEALIRRADAGLPRIDRLTDTYNAISVLRRTPIGGENARAYRGSPQLVVADGSEVFETVREGEPVEEIIPAGEIVWKDDVGVTCRRWNWRQCVRTRLDEQTTEAVFIVDALGSDAVNGAAAVLDDVITQLSVDSPNMRFEKLVLHRP